MGRRGRRRGRRKRWWQRLTSKADRRPGWREAASRLGASLQEEGKPTSDRIVLDEGGPRIVVETYVQSTGNSAQTFTRARAYFAGRRELELKLRPRNGFDRLLESLGWGGRPPLGAALTDRYVIKGKPAPRIPSMFGGELRNVLADLDDVYLKVERAPRKVRKRHGQDAGSVTCLAGGTVIDPGRLAAMARAVRATLDALVAIGEARMESLDQDD